MAWAKKSLAEPTRLRTFLFQMLPTTERTSSSSRGGLFSKFHCRHLPSASSNVAPSPIAAPARLVHSVFRCPASTPCNQSGEGRPNPPMPFLLLTFSARVTQARGSRLFGNWHLNSCRHRLCAQAEQAHRSNHLFDVEIRESSSPAANRKPADRFQTARSTFSVSQKIPQFGHH